MIKVGDHVRLNKYHSKKYPNLWVVESILGDPEHYRTEIRIRNVISKRLRKPKKEINHWWESGSLGTRIRDVTKLG